MISAKELRKTMPGKNILEVRLEKVINNIMPKVEKQVKEIACYGIRATSISRKNLLENVKTDMFTYGEIMNKLIEELKKLGYSASASGAFTTLYISW